LTLIDMRHRCVVANFRETELKGVRTGTPATVYLMSNRATRQVGAQSVVVAHADISVGDSALGDHNGLNDSQIGS
jgi:multidrug resistance efflux pump